MATDMQEYLSKHGLDYKHHYTIALKQQAQVLDLYLVPSLFYSKTLLIRYDLNKFVKFRRFYKDL
jgi:hypothetical protein